MPRRYTSRDLRILAEKGLDAELPPPKKRNNEEFRMQCALISWWHQECDRFGVPEILLWHTPNSAVYGGSKEQREKMGAMLKRLGQRSGVPDLFLSVPSGHWHGLFVELKSSRGVVSPEQTYILSCLQDRGYHTVVCRTLEDAQIVITNYLNAIPAKVHSRIS
jgi:hypothetical protein